MNRFTGRNQIHLRPLFGLAQLTENETIMKITTPAITPRAAALAIAAVALLTCVALGAGVVLDAYKGLQMAQLAEEHGNLYSQTPPARPLVTASAPIAQP